MSRHARLTRLEKTVPAQADRPGPRTDEEWLELFDLLLKAGFAEREPDYSQAVREFGEALATPEGPDREWPQRQAFLWLLSMIQRAQEGRPPVTLTEYAALSAWFTGNLRRLYAHAEPGSGLLEVGGKTINLAAVNDIVINHGPRGLGTTEAAEDLRLLRQYFGSNGGDRP